MPRLLLYTLYVVIALLSKAAKAQTYYRSWGTSSVFEAGEAITKYENDLIIGGTKNDSAFVMRVDPTGNVAWIKRFKALGSTGRHYVNHLKISSNGYILGTGYAIVSSIAYGYYFKLDVAGNFIFLKSNSTATYFRSIYEKNSSEYLIFGARTDPTGPTNTDIKVLTVDQASGNITYQADMLDLQSTTGFSFTDDMEGNAKVDNNTYFSTGRIYLYPGSTGMRPHLNKYDNTGNVIWSKFLHKNGAGTSRTYPQGVIYKNGYLYIPYASDEICSGGCTNYYPGLIKTDTMGNVIFDYTYDLPSSDGELTRTITTDGTFYYIIGFSNYNSGNRDIFIIKTDANGALIKSRTFGDAVYNENFLVSFIQPVYCDSSFIYITGSKNTSTSNSDVFLMKIDTDLNLACGANDVLVNAAMISPYSEVMIPQYHVENTAPTGITSNLSHYIAESSACTLANLVDTVYLSGLTTLDANYTGATGYLWAAGATTSGIFTDTAGTYTCTVSVGCCSFVHKFVVISCSDTISIVNNNPLCQGESLTVSLDGYPSFFSTYGSSTFTGNSFTVIPSLGDNVFTIHATDGGCSQDTVFIYHLPVPDPITFITPSSFCQGDSVILEAAGSYTFTWSEGSYIYPGASITVLADISHSYNVTGLNANGCTVDTNYTLTVDTCNVIDVTDTVFLSAVTILLDAADPGATSYLWNDGSSGSGLNVSMAGVYSCIINFNCCSYIHTFVIADCPHNFGIITGPDSLCYGESVTLTAGGGSTFSWNTLSTDASIHITPASTQDYWVIVYANGGCSDTVMHQVYVLPIPFPPLMHDTVLCQGDIILQQATGQHILWYTGNTDTAGSTEASFLYTDIPGTYTYYATQTINGCQSNRAICTYEVKRLPYFDLPDSVTLCLDDSLNVGPDMLAGCQYSWSDLVHISPRMINESGIYGLTVQNQCGSYTDSCKVVRESCECFFYLPNAFTPDADGLNETFKPVYACRFESFVMRIFNRWGQLIFESNDPATGWDGKYHGLLSKEDVYVVQIQYIGLEGSGRVTKALIRHVTLLK